MYAELRAAQMARNDPSEAVMDQARFYLKAVNRYLRNQRAARKPAAAAATGD